MEDDSKAEESADLPYGDPRKAAGDLAMHLVGSGSGEPTDDKLTADELDALSGSQTILCSETRYLFLSQSKSYTNEGQSRIRENLYKVIDLMGDRPTEVQQEIIRKLGRAIGHAALYGLSLDGVKLTPTIRMHQDKFR